MALVAVAGLMAQPKGQYPKFPANPRPCIPMRSRTGRAQMGQCPCVSPRLRMEPEADDVKTEQGWEDKTWTAMC